jgi:glycerol dehydrogenase-like iron-containing ADH family enzyme
LLSYDGGVNESYRLAGVCAGRILHGEKVGVGVFQIEQKPGWKSANVATEQVERTSESEGILIERAKLERDIH